MTRDNFIFDLDGTLVDSAPGIQAALQQAFSAIGRPWPGGDIRAVIGPPIRIIAKRLDAALSDDQTASIERSYRGLYDGSGWLRTDLYPGVAATLRTLCAAGHTLFVATNKPLLPTTRLLAHLGLTDLFRAVLTRDSATPPFASKAVMLAQLIETYALQPDRTMMVGDTTEDGEAAVQNHIPFAFATYGYGTVANAALPINQLADLLVHAAQEEAISA